MEVEQQKKTKHLVFSSVCVRVLVYVFPYLQRHSWHLLSSQFKSKATAKTFHSIVLLWSRTAFMLKKPQCRSKRQKMLKRWKTLKNFTVVCFSLNRDNISPEWELKLERLESVSKIQAAVKWWWCWWWCWWRSGGGGRDLWMKTLSLLMLA